VTLGRNVTTITTNAARFGVIHWMAAPRLTRRTVMKQLFTNLMNDESGQDLIEYALIAALIALGAIVAMGSLSNKIGSEFNTIGSSL
jgi:pilus assembly protein Flp/PilA